MPLPPDIAFAFAEKITRPGFRAPEIICAIADFCADVCTTEADAARVVAEILRWNRWPGSQAARTFLSDIVMVPPVPPGTPIYDVAGRFPFESAFHESVWREILELPRETRDWLEGFARGLVGQLAKEPGCERVNTMPYMMRNIRAQVIRLYRGERETPMFIDPLTGYLRIPQDRPPW
jgi:hypothetical protein